MYQSHLVEQDDFWPRFMRCREWLSKRNWTESQNARHYGRAEPEVRYLQNDDTNEIQFPNSWDYHSDDMNEYELDIEQNV